MNTPHTSTYYGIIMTEEAKNLLLEIKKNKVVHNTSTSEQELEDHQLGQQCLVIIITGVKQTMTISSMDHQNNHYKGQHDFIKWCRHRLGKDVN